MADFLPDNPPLYVVNRCFPESSGNDVVSTDPEAWLSPLAEHQNDYVVKRGLLERSNLKLWSDRQYISLPFLPPSESREEISRSLSSQWSESP